MQIFKIVNNVVGEDQMNQLSLEGWDLISIHPINTMEWRTVWSKEVDPPTSSSPVPELDQSLPDTKPIPVVDQIIAGQEKLKELL